MAGYLVVWSFGFGWDVVLVLKCQCGKKKTMKHLFSSKLILVIIPIYQHLLTSLSVSLSLSDDDNSISFSSW